VTITRRFRWALIAAAWALAGFIAFATLCPQTLRPHLADAQFERFGAYFVTAGAFVLAYPRRPVLIAVAATAFAILLELGQLIAPGRDAGVPDVIAKVLGGLCGTAIASLFPRLWPSARP
jgi:VanZ like family